MANRKPWRRPMTSHSAPAQPPPSAPARLHKQQPTPLNFAGIKDTVLTNVLGALLAKDVTVNSVDGSLYAGLFGGTERAQNKDELCVMLRYGQLVKGNAKKCIFLDVRGGTARKILIPFSQISSVTAAQIDFDTYATTNTTAETAAKARVFATDGEISRGNPGAGRQLKRFDDFVDMKSSTPTASLDEQTFGDMASNGRSSKKWDQFQVNERKFGVKTSFDEDEYTTKIDRKGANFAERQREAERLASEIEGKSSENVHQREERNQDVGTDFDEEEMYSGVQRTLVPKPASRGAAPPAPETAKPQKAAPERPRLSYAAAAAAGSGNSAAAPAIETRQPPAKVPNAAAAEKKDTSHKAQKSNHTAKNRPAKDSLPQIAKIRSAVAGRTSPKQSRNSPLTTPASTDSSAVAVLNLDAQTPNLGPEQIKRFEEYKANREMQSIAENREKITDDLKKFSTQLDSRNGPLRRGQGSGNVNSPAVSGELKEVVKVEQKAAPENGPTKASSEQENESEKSDVTPVVKVEPKLEVKAEAAVEVETKGEEKEEVEEMKKEKASLTSKVKSKSKLKLNPNAQEFKFNPDAPSFEPVGLKANAPVQAQKVYSPYQQGGGGGGSPPMEYSQAMQAGPQGYPVAAMQTMGQMPYGQPYAVVVPGQMSAPMAPAASGYQFVHGNHGSFPMSPVQGRYAQNPGVPSYGYPMHPNVVIAQPPQRIPSAPYPYYGSGPYGGGQGGAGHLPPPHQSPVYQPHMQQQQQGAVPHMSGGNMPMGGRGNHSNGRRGGGGKGRGKHHGHHSHGHHSGSATNNVEKSGQRPSESVMPVDGNAQR